MAAFLLCLLINTIIVYSTKYCDNVKECTSLNIEEDLFCRGYKSCATTSIESTGTAYCVGNEACADSQTFTAKSINCYGDTACSGAVSMEATSGSIVCSGILGCADVTGDLKATNDVLCEGVGSCSGLAGSIISAGTVSCGGEYACANIKGSISGYYVEATGTDSGRDNTYIVRDKAYFSGSYSAFGSSITAQGNIQADGPYSTGNSILTAGDDIRLFGYGSGYKSSISRTPTIYAHGYYSAAYADIYGTNDKPTTVQFYGHFAGYYTNVWCEYGAKCTVSCKGTACLETKIYYEKGAELSFSPEKCMEDDNQGVVYEGVRCPSFAIYTKANKEEIAQERQTERENTIKWTSLDDDYSKGGYEGDPTKKLRLRTQAMLGLDLENEDNEIKKGNSVMKEMENEQATVAIRLIIIVALLACAIFGVVIHLVCNNHKGTEKLAANLLYT